MERISSMLFMIALITYYIPKFIKAKKCCYVKIHIVTGILSIVAMIGALIEKIGHGDFIKYIGFTIIMVIIGGTGYLMKKKYKLYRYLHIIFTVLFFVYLFITIRFI